MNFSFEQKKVAHLQLQEAFGSRCISTGDLRVGPIASIYRPFQPTDLWCHCLIPAFVCSRWHVCRIEICIFFSLIQGLDICFWSFSNWILLFHLSLSAVAVVTCAEPCTVEFCIDVGLQSESGSGCRAPAGSSPGEPQISGVVCLLPTTTAVLSAQHFSLQPRLEFYFRRNILHSQITLMGLVITLAMLCWDSTL